MPAIPIIIIIGVGALIARTVQKARKRDAAFLKKVEAQQAQERG